MVGGEGSFDGAIGVHALREVFHSILDVLGVREAGREIVRVELTQTVVSVATHSTVLKTACDFYESKCERIGNIVVFTFSVKNGLKVVGEGHVVAEVALLEESSSDFCILIGAFERIPVWGTVENERYRGTDR